MPRVSALDLARAVEDVDASLSRLSRATLHGGTPHERHIAASQYHRAWAQLRTLAAATRQQQKDAR
ncbi:MAG: hypothetical protein MUE77_12085 [Sandarakinorhabdus sp.]|jgi:hypothetical protein|nr:hypothetical protein [Sandarakinorhabdus sp.]